MASNTPHKSRRQGPVHDNFLEALRDLGKDFASDATTQVKQAFSADLPQSFGLSGTLNPNESLSLSQIEQAENRGKQQAEAAFTRQLEGLRQQQETYSRQKQAEIRQQIQLLKQEILAFAKTAGDFASEVQKATSQMPSSPGVYHKNFYIHLKSVISGLRQKVESSRQWLAAANTRASKRGYYWGQVGKSGAKYMLSSERYMVTSTG
ncbi:MAG: hypothetical protein UX91_C0005G0030 [Candidatus Amesbacteria bacterium GW2011_GWB1_47_19]|nr:MAG: hypothetical protein UW51_C0007G0030 [Candidatus Amesbacteria bacterium GW2011_GWA1_44_24]KKU31112.1 MAG: hypothetical protein UX46_C0007G0030 [Candidatus Amesbacteria bacterium GW2011_GWC1_46_24]KKU67233.1 MAG: hypothetical protein UX91_C0005G0030 [Candidatus Amesbacteria bacterium GW2011_GWB1_47_19]OGD05792.1 MAG: hypothetical protein A2379_01555 [Candidatus Amesbacteria bacterium RIFOXYB1_FULL_47_13]HBC72649.1 hypothetical protein [Candidatus Amesbacteria bacterium]